VEPLEERLVLSTDSAPFFAALTTHRYWIDYSPSYDSTSDPYNANPSDARITADLETLYSEGWRGLVTYTLLGTYADIPRIAKSVGFQWVVAGVYYPTNAAEVAMASSPDVLPYTDAYVVGNEGLTDGRYAYSDLTTAIGQVQKATGKPVSTSEPGGAYYAGATYATQLLGLGDWLFPNIDYFLWGGQPSTPQFMWTNVSFIYQYMNQHQTTPGPVVAKEVFYPSAGGPQASDANQIAWYGSEAVPNTVDGKPFYFVWGEAFDQPWKISINAYEPHMGLHLINNPDGTAQPKPIIGQLQAAYTGTYGASAGVVSTPVVTAAPTPIPTPTLAAATWIDAPKARRPAHQVQLAFSAALDAASARQAGDYHVTQRIGEAKSRVVPVRAVIYNPGSTGILLRLGRFLPGKALKLTVSGLVNTVGTPVPTITARVGRRDR
jgi:hypothetical protein